MIQSLMTSGQVPRDRVPATAARWVRWAASAGTAAAPAGVAQRPCMAAGGTLPGGGPSSPPRSNCIACTMPPASAALSIGTTTSRVFGADASAWNART